MERLDVGEIVDRLFGPVANSDRRVLANDVRRAVVDHQRYFERCSHPRRERVASGRHGSSIKRYPLRYGSAEVEACMVCGGWRTMHHGPGAWQAGPYTICRIQAEINGDDY